MRSISFWARSTCVCCCTCKVVRLLQRMLGLPLLGDIAAAGRLKVTRIHARHDLPGFHAIAFIDHHLRDAAGKFGVDVDRIGFEPAVAKGKSRRQVKLLKVPPINAAAARSSEPQRQHKEKPARPVFFGKDRQSAVWLFLQRGRLRLDGRKSAALRGRRGLILMGRNGRLFGLAHRWVLIGSKER